MIPTRGRNRESRESGDSGNVSAIRACEGSLAAVTFFRSVEAHLRRGRKHCRCHLISEAAEYSRFDRLIKAFSSARDARSSLKSTPSRKLQVGLPAETFLRLVQLQQLGTYGANPTDVGRYLILTAINKLIDDGVLPKAQC